MKYKVWHIRDVDMKTRSTVPCKREDYSDKAWVDPLGRVVLLINDGDNGNEMLYRHWLGEPELFEIEVELQGEGANRIKALTAEVARLKADNEWISVEDRLPDKQGEYLCCINGWSLPRLEFWHAEKHKWVTYNGVRYWRPVPQPPAQAEEGK